MNRPFYALGVLMAFLALATLAIGLSSRPTALQPSAGGSGTELHRRQPGVTMYVVMLPNAGEQELLGLLAADDVFFAPLPCGSTIERSLYTGDSPLDWAIGDVHSAPYVRPIGSWANAAQSGNCLQPVIVRVVGMVRLEEIDRSNSLATGYDAAYDQAMRAELGSLWQVKSASSSFPSEPPAMQLQELDAEDPMVLIFDSLVRSKTTQRGPNSYLGKFRARRWDYEVKSVAIGAQNRLWQLLVFAGVADEWTKSAVETGLMNGARVNTLSGPTWAEYMAWIGSKQWTVARRDGSNTNSVAIWSQPSDQLLQIAVAGLNRVAELLHELIGQWVDRAADRLAERAGRAAQPDVQK